jgi:hypothetical protein
LSLLAERFLWNETVIIAAGFVAETRVSKKSLAATMARGGEDQMRMMSIMGELDGHSGTIEDAVRRARQFLGHHAVWAAVMEVAHVLSCRGVVAREEFHAIIKKHLEICLDPTPIARLEIRGDRILAVPERRRAA